MEPTGELRRIRRKLILILVSYHMTIKQAKELGLCLSDLSVEIGYAVVVNDHKENDPADRLANKADFFLRNKDNPGYGRAVNMLFKSFDYQPDYIGVLNIDLSWELQTFERAFNWLVQHPSVVLAVPKILDERGKIQKLCKQNPTVLALLSRRFVSQQFKPAWMKRYDQWYVMSDFDYNKVFEVQYLSGCCMIIKSQSFRRIGGFDERFFLYLEDADITRMLSYEGQCIHLPLVSVTHVWGKGSYKSFFLLLVNVMSAFYYFSKWRVKLW